MSTSDRTGVDKPTSIAGNVWPRWRNGFRVDNRIVGDARQACLTRVRMANMVLGPVPCYEIAQTPPKAGRQQRLQVKVPGQAIPVQVDNERVLRRRDRRVRYNADHVRLRDMQEINQVGRKYWNVQERPLHWVQQRQERFLKTRRKPRSTNEVSSHDGRHEPGTAQGLRRSVKRTQRVSRSGGR